ncbi:MAG: zinc-dependent peptidase [Chitinophagaceae bacterium]|nr:zinc-dependent peptidase [Chitinophagaceae bacterium]
MADINDIIFAGGIIATIILIAWRNNRYKNTIASTANNHFLPDDLSQEVTLVYAGDELNFPDEIIITVLEKYFPYFRVLPGEKKKIFLMRIKKFISSKTFVIHNNSGFREMPILISATAIKLSMGLERFMLPHYTHIHIFPVEFLGLHPNLRVLTGNVSGNKIHISWKHFLEGYQFPEDGQNVGLHEMAHAYYYQNFITREDVDNNFADQLHIFNDIGNTIFEKEKNNTTPFYSSYGLTNFQEFWAESVELFFEKPLSFKNTYGELYYVMVNILNQDPSGDILL